MQYEITLLVKLDPDADFAGTDDEAVEVYELVDSAVKDIDDLKIIEMEVREYG